MTGPILFDGSILAAKPVTGVGGAFLTTLRSYVAAPLRGQPPVLLLPESADDPEIDGLTVHRLTNGGRRRREQVRTILRELGAAMLHSPVALIPRRATCPTIATVHDIPWHVEADTGEKNHGDRDPGDNWRHRLAVRRAAKRATAIITPSQTTARHLSELHAPRTKVQVIPHGVELPDRLATDPNGPFLVLGDNRPRKNLPAVRQAYKLAKLRLPELPDLCLVGPGQPLGYLSEERKWQVLRNSRALLHLALFEGFGIPVIEAFAHGVPVVTSNRGSMQEIAGDAALLADPTNIEAMAAAILHVHQNEALRDDLITRGWRKAAAWNASHTAQAWHELHQELTACT